MKKAEPCGGQATRHKIFWLANHSLSSGIALGIGDPKFEKFEGHSVDDCVAQPLDIKANRMWDLN